MTLINPFGRYPVVGTIRQCIGTETGWCGVDEAGVVINVISRNGEPVFLPDNDYVLKFEHGKIVGALLIERAYRYPLA